MCVPSMFWILIVPFVFVFLLEQQDIVGDATAQSLYLFKAQCKTSP